MGKKSVFKLRFVIFAFLILSQGLFASEWNVVPYSIWVESNNSGAKLEVKATKYHGKITFIMRKKSHTSFMYGCTFYLGN